MWGSEFTTKAAALQVVSAQKSCPTFVYAGIGPVVNRARVQFKRYLIVVLLFAAALVVRRRYLTVVPRPMPAAPRRYLSVVPRPFLAAPLVAHSSYEFVARRPISAAPHRNFVIVPRPMLVAPFVLHRRCPGRCQRRCSLFVAGT